MLTGFLALLTAIPGIGAVVNGVSSAFFNAKVRIFQARTGATRDVAVEAIRAAATESHEQTSRLQTIASNKPLTFLLIGFAAPLVIFVWKVVVVDIVIGPGCVPYWWGVWHGGYWLCWIGDTDPIRGQVADWATTIIGFLFGSATTVSVGKMALSAVDKLKG